MLKAHIESPVESQTLPDGPLAGLGGMVESALVRVYGSKKAAAIELEKDRSQLRRQLEMGTLMIRELDRPEVLAALGEVLVEEFGGARKSKKQIAIQRLPELLALMLDAVTEDK